MCGIIGVVTDSAFGFSERELTKFNNMLICDSVRGQDSTGVFGVNKYGNVSFLKEKGHPFNLLESEEYLEFSMEALSRMRMLIGHNRKATIGKITAETAHPFQEGNIILVHNGTLTTHRNLTEQAVEVDSHAITHSIAERGYRETLKELDGAFTLVWYDASDKILRMARNDRRPLSVLKIGNQFVISSEYSLANWIFSREDKVNITNYDIKPGSVYHIELDKPDTLWETPVEIKKTQVYLPQQPIAQALQEEKPTLEDQSTRRRGRDKQKGEGSKTYESYPVQSGDTLVVQIDTVTPFNGDLTGAKYVAYAKCHRMVNDNTPVYVHLTQEECDMIDAHEKFPLLSVLVFRVVFSPEKRGPERIYAGKSQLYHPQIDATGNEVLEEEFNATTKLCLHCKTMVTWNDISSSKFRFKSPSKYHLTCPNCFEEGKV